MKILVTGARGQLGYDVCRELQSRNIAHKGVDVDDFDITDAASTSAYVTAYIPTAVIHCAAFTAVDRAESEPARCHLINVTGTENLATAVAEINAKLLYLSTDYVFCGNGDFPHATDAPTAPLSVYGASKLLGEEAVRNATNRHFIVRTSWVFGTHGNNFAKTMLRLSETQPALNVVDDQIGSPTYTRDLAVLLCDMIATEQFGTYHATNEGFCSWADFAEEIMQQSNRHTVIRRVASEEYPTAAPRPRNSRLSKDKLTDNGFSRLPYWRDALRRYLEEERTQSRQ